MYIYIHVYIYTYIDIHVYILIHTHNLSMYICIIFINIVSQKDQEQAVTPIGTGIAPERVSSLAGAPIKMVI